MFSLELKQRILSALVLATLAVIGVYLGGKVFSALAIISGLFIFYEWCRIVRTADQQPAVMFLGWIVLAISFLFLLLGWAHYSVVVILAGFILSTFLSWKGGGRFWIAFGIIYASFPVIALSELRGQDVYGLFAILFIFTTVWATDIFAFFCGRALGGPKLAPKISPGKTWSGAIFGLAAGVGTGLLVVMMLRYGGGFFVPLIAALISIVSQMGDLFESWIKRRFGVKDSSNLIPGHGGFMDRLDGVVFASILAYFIATLDQISSGIDSSEVLAIHLLGL